MPKIFLSLLLFFVEQPFVSSRGLDILFSAHCSVNLRLPCDSRSVSVYSFFTELLEVERLRLPSLADGYNLGYFDRNCVQELLEFNLQYQACCERNYILDIVNRGYWGVCLAEAKWLFRVYDVLDDSLCIYNSVFTRRLALGKLRDILGEENFYRGPLPPHIPLWRFSFVP